MEIEFYAFYAFYTLTAFADDASRKKTPFSGKLVPFDSKPEQGAGVPLFGELPLTTDRKLKLIGR